MDAAGERAESANAGGRGEGGVEDRSGALARRKASAARRRRRRRVRRRWKDDDGDGDSDGTDAVARRWLGGRVGDVREVFTGGVRGTPRGALEVSMRRRRERRRKRRDDDDDDDEMDEIDRGDDDGVRSRPQGGGGNRAEGTREIRNRRRVVCETAPKRVRLGGSSRPDAARRPRLPVGRATGARRDRFRRDVSSKDQNRRRVRRRLVDVDVDVDVD